MRRKFVCLTEDQTVLAKVARFDTDRTVRRIAITRLKDQVLLMEIAKNDRDIEIRKNAIRAITDQDVLIRIAENLQDYDLALRKVAVHTISDEMVQKRMKKKLADEDIELFSSFSPEEKRFLLTQKPSLLRMIRGKRASANSNIPVYKLIKISGRYDPILDRLTDTELDALIRVNELAQKATQLADTDPAAAIEKHKEILRIVPWDGNSIMSIGFFLVALKKYEEALDWFRRAQAADPSNERIEKNIGVVLKRIQAPTNFVHTDPNPSVLAQIARDFYDWAETSGCLQNDVAHAIKEFPRYPQAIEIGRQLNKKGGFKAMHRLYNQAADINPSQIEIIKKCWDGIGRWRG